MANNVVSYVRIQTSPWSVFEGEQERDTPVHLSGIKRVLLHTALHPS